MSKEENSGCLLPILGKALRSAERIAPRAMDRFWAWTDRLLADELTELEVERSERKTTQALPTDSKNAESASKKEGA